MEQGTGIFIAVPEDLAAKILCEGYQCSRRRRVPAHRNREGAIQAYRRSHRSRPRHTLLEVASLPSGVTTTTHKDGIKLETPHLPARCFVSANRSYSTSGLSTPMPSSFGGYQPAPRPASVRPSPQGPVMSGTRASDRQLRLERRDNVQTLYHCTSQSNAINICNSKQFHAGSHGFLGPGIYFSRTAANARRYCQCRSGTGGRVVIRCEVNLGTTKRVPKGHYTGHSLVNDGCDAYDEIGRDCYMLPDDKDGQILSMVIDPYA